MVVGFLCPVLVQSKGFCALEFSGSKFGDSEWGRSCRAWFLSVKVVP